MQRDEMEHLLRAAGDILDGETAFIVIGSQSILGKYPNAPEQLLLSAEADFISKNKPRLNHKLEVIGEESPFHETHGYFVDPVDKNTAILPVGWEGRLVNLTGPGTNGVVGLCLEPHDLFVSKMAAGREKDIEFCKVMIEHNLVGKERVLELAAKVKSPDDDKDRSRRIMASIERIYNGVDLSKMVHVNEVSGYYTGKIVSVSGTVVQQEAGKGKMIFHQADKLNYLPIVGRSYDIRYKDGTATVKRKDLSTEKKLEHG